MAVEPGGIGARLRAGREKLGLTVLQVAERIHTDTKIVEAIEAENFEALGAPVYARGHIRHYAELVGESGSELNQLYTNLSTVGQPDLTRISKAPAGADTSKLVAPALLVIAVFAVAGAIWWVSALSKKKPELSETHVVGDEPAASPGVAAQPDAATLQSAPPPSGAMSMQPRSANSPSGSMAMQPPSSAQPGANGATAGSSQSRRAGAATSADGGSAGATRTPLQSGGSASTPSRLPGSAGIAAAPSGTAGGRASGTDSNGAAYRAGATVPTPAPASPTRDTAPSRQSQATKAGAAHSPPSAAAPTAAQNAARSTRTASASPTRPAAAAAAGADNEPVSATPAPASVAGAPTKNQSRVTLHFTADSWTEVYDATGARLFYDVGAANSVQTVVGTPPLRVVLANAAGVAVELNGHGKDIAKLLRPDGSVQFSINRSGQIVRAKPVAGGG